MILNYVFIAIVKLAKNKGYKYKKSDEYYRVEVTIRGSVEDTRILVNVAKNPNADSRWLAFILISGDKTIFDKAFLVFKKHCKTKFDYAKDQ